MGICYVYDFLSLFQKLYWLNLKTIFIALAALDTCQETSRGWEYTKIDDFRGVLSYCREF